jgi:hypothetical protein
MDPAGASPQQSQGMVILFSDGRLAQQSERNFRLFGPVRDDELRRPGTNVYLAVIQPFGNFGQTYSTFAAAK